MNDHVKQLVIQRKKEIIADLREMGIIVPKKDAGFYTAIRGICDSIVCQADSHGFRLHVDSKDFSCLDKVLVYIDRREFPVWTLMMRIEPISVDTKVLPRVDLFQAIRTPTIGQIKLETCCYDFKLKTNFVELIAQKDDVMVHVNDENITNHVRAFAIELEHNKSPQMSLNVIC